MTTGRTRGVSGNAFLAGTERTTLSTVDDVAHVLTDSEAGVVVYGTLAVGVTLPDPVTREGRVYTVKSRSTAAVTITSAGIAPNDEIDGLASLVLVAGTNSGVQCVAVQRPTDSLWEWVVF